ncbi:hypothetical protein L7F22_059154 [Adiantum nelumboides]|nr:hypothetical protein [Adiantum nelumboides]
MVMESSFLFRAKSAIHNAAAKAERLLTEIKEDFKTDLGRSASSTGDDGLTHQFFMQYWDSQSLQEGLQEIFDTRCMPTLMSSGIVSLTPKGGDASTLRQHTLMSSDRSILDNVVTCYEAVEWARQTEQPVAIMLLDFEKAYDKVEWGFLEGTLYRDPEKKYFLWFKDDGDVPSECFEDDKDLQNLRFDYVPNKMQEHQFWKYYMIAIDRVKKNLSPVSQLSGIDDSVDQDQPDLESPRKDPIEEDAYERAMSLAVVPSSKLLRKLAEVIEISRSINNVKDLISMKAEKEFAQNTGALVSGMKAMKNSLLRENKDSKPSREEVQACVQSLFEPGNKFDYSGCQTKLVEDIRGAPPGSFVSHMAEVMGSLRTHQRMAEFWCKLVLELQHHWDQGLLIPRLPLDSEPDLRYCLILQKLQVINCCIARQKRHAADLSFLDTLNECTESFESLRTTDLGNFITMLKSKIAAEDHEKLEAARLFAYGKEGQVFLRLGANFPAPNLTMLETGQQVYEPKMQEGHVLTEDLIDEKEELVLRTGSMGAGCSPLLSDMQAFQAANPGCILEDFVRWYSPPDWSQSQYLESSGKDIKHETVCRGYLSARMQAQGNLWQELWSSAKPIPAARQAPLFDEELAVESTLNELEDIAPAFLFEQLFIAIVGTGFAVAESSTATKGRLVSAQFLECKNFVTSICRKGITIEELKQLCQVYEIMETVLQCPSEDPQASKLFNFFRNDESVPLSEKRSKSSSGLVANEKSMHKHSVNEPKNSFNGKSEHGFTLFSRILEAKSIIFYKKLPQVHTTVEKDKRMAAQESEWTVI